MSTVVKNGSLSDLPFFTSSWELEKKDKLVLSEKALQTPLAFFEPMYTWSMRQLHYHIYSENTSCMDCLQFENVVTDISQTLVRPVCDACKEREMAVRSSWGIDEDGMVFFGFKDDLEIGFLFQAHTLYNKENNTLLIIYFKEFENSKPPENIFRYFGDEQEDLEIMKEVKDSVIVMHLEPLTFDKYTFTSGDYVSSLLEVDPINMLGDVRVKAHSEWLTRLMKEEQ